MEFRRVLFRSVLGSNYRGLRPGLARWAAAAGLLVPLALYGVVTVWLSTSLRRAAPATEPSSGEPAGSTEHDRPGSPLTRRAALAGAGTIVIGFVGAWLARALTRRATFGSFGYDGMQTRSPKVDPVTPNDQFYVVTKNLVDPNVVGSLWRVSVGGLVHRP